MTPEATYQVNRFEAIGLYLGTWLRSDATLFERRGIRGHLALHPAVSQFLLDNARGTSRGSGLNSVGKALRTLDIG